MTDAQSLVFQVVGSLCAALFLAAIWFRDRWPSLRAAVARLRVQAAALLPTPAARAQASAGTTRAPLLVEGHRWLIVGAPGSGKSTAARQLMRGYIQQGASILVADPEGAAWPRGVRMVGSPDDYEAIGVALEWMQTQAQKRRFFFQRGVRSFPPLLLVIDEGPMVLRATPGAIEIVADLARRGRKINISVILLATDTQAKTLGLEGQTKLLDSFVRLDARMTPAGVELWESDQLRTRIALDLQATDLVLPEPPTADSPVSPDADRLLASALGLAAGTGSHGSQGSVSGDSVVPSREPVPMVPTGSDPVPGDSHAVPGAFDEEVIRTLHAAGWSRTRIANKIGGRRADTFARLRQVLGDE